MLAYPIIIRASSSRKESKIFAKKLQSCMIDFLDSDCVDSEYDNKMVASWINNVVVWNKKTWDFHEWDTYEFIDNYDMVSDDIIPKLFQMDDTRGRLFDLIIAMSNNGLQIDDVISNDGTHILYTIMEYGGKDADEIMKWFLNNRFNIQKYVTPTTIAPGEYDVDMSHEHIPIIVNWIDNANESEKQTLLQCEEIQNILTQLCDEVLPEMINFYAFMNKKLTVEMISYKNDIELWNTSSFNPEYKDVIAGTVNMLNDLKDETEMMLQDTVESINEYSDYLNTVIDLCDYDDDDECDGECDDDDRNGCNWPKIRNTSELFPDTYDGCPVNQAIMAYIVYIGGNSIRSITVDQNKDCPITIIVNSNVVSDRYDLFFAGVPRINNYIHPADIICVDTQ